MIEFIKSVNNWSDVLNAARNTVNKQSVNKEPSSEWKRKVLMSEHSPIRMLTFYWKWSNIKSWVSQHIARHNKFSEHFVSTNREDRTGINRDRLSQSEPVNHESYANAQEIIFISRKRLCKQASIETQKEWKDFLKELKKIEPELYSVCVPECVYRGFCPEFECCGYVNTDEFERSRSLYTVK